jgi:hypothetical protein
MDRCGLAWDSLPPLADRPVWLVSVDQPEDLRTSEAYTYLEERLTTLGLMTGNQAGDGGQRNMPQPVNLDTRSESLMAMWQNQFDGSIMDGASARGLPARLLKSLFAQESQFWPGLFPEAGEVGLGHMSVLGADNLLLWSPSFYSEFCPKVFHADTCRLPYSRLPEEQKEMLRSALLASVNSDCADCPGFVDLDKAQQTVLIFAESLAAYCSQTGRMVYNVVRETPGLVSSYEDLWRFTLANYNGGSGCLALALTKTSRQRQPMDWNHVAANLPGNCQNAAEYVSRILGERSIQDASDAE